MKDLLKELNKLSYAIDKQLRETVDDLAKEALKDVELAIAMTQTVTENSLEVQNYRIEGKSNTIQELENHDMEYCNALYEVYMHKNNKYVLEDISLAKIDNATRKLQEAKQKIIRKL